MCRNEVGPYLVWYANINSKWNKYINVRAKTTKSSEEKNGEKFCDMGFGNDFLNMTPNAQVTKETIDELDSIKI